MRGKVTRISALLCAATVLLGCDRLPITPEGKARSAISHLLIDPSSGRFSYTNKSEKYVCGTVNAKNRMGAYSGDALFIYDMTSNEAELYNGPPDITDYNMWSEHAKEGMTGSDEYYDKMETGCKFPDDWKQKCSSITAAAIPQNEAFCTAWKNKDFNALYTMAHDY